MPIGRWTAGGHNPFQFLWLAGVDNGRQPGSASRCNAKLPTLVSSEGPSTSRNRGVFFLVRRGELRANGNDARRPLRAGGARRTNVYVPASAGGAQEGAIADARIPERNQALAV